MLGHAQVWIVRKLSSSLSNTNFCGGLVKIKEIHKKTKKKLILHTLYTCNQYFYDAVAFLCSVCEKAGRTN